MILKPEAETSHRCLLPRRESGDPWDGTLFYCEDCGQRWIAYTDYSYWLDYSWKPLGWWQRKEHRRINKALAERKTLHALTVLDE